MTLPLTGTYTIAVNPAGPEVGQATAEVWNVPADVAVGLAIDGGPISATNTVRGQNLTYSFPGTLGQRVSLQYSYRASSPVYNCTPVTVRNPDGSALHTGGCDSDSGYATFVEPVTLAQAGIYTISFDPPATDVGQATAEVWTVPADTSASLAIDGGPVSLGNAARGQNLGYTFAGTQGQRVSMQYSYRAASPNYGCLPVTVMNPDGSVLRSDGCASDSGGATFVEPITLPQTGTYTIALDPPGADAGQATAQLWTVPADAAASLSMGSGPVTAGNTVPGQNLAYTFSGMQGQRVSMQYSYRASSPSYSCLPVTIRNPDGTTLRSDGCDADYGGTTFVDPLTLPQTGGYTISFDPPAADIGQASAEVWTVPADAAGVLTIDGGAVSTPNTVRGQNIAVTFSGTQGQRVSMQYSYGASSPIYNCLPVTVRNPDGSVLRSDGCDADYGSAVAAGPFTLSQTGTYTISFDPPGPDVGQATTQVSTATSAARAPLPARSPAARSAQPATPAPRPPTAAGRVPRGVDAAGGPPPATPTAGPPPAPAPTGQTEDWHPNQQRGLPPDFRTHRPPAAAQSLPSLQAPPGVTATAGQALKLNGDPLPGVTLAIGRVSARTDATGRFLLRDLPAGQGVLSIDGTSADREGASYGYFEAGVNVVAGRTSTLPFPIWMTKLDTAHEITIPSPTTSEMVLTNPGIPGLEIHLPAGTVIRDRKGKPVTRLSLTPIPVDRPPFPLPIAVDVPIYFTVQPGGSYVWPKGARIVYPNFTHLAPGTRVQFWDYDAGKKGWFVYGSGSVTGDGRQVMPDPGVVVWEFSGAMFDGSGFTKWVAGWLRSALGIDADPVDLGTGYFAYQKTDLALPDTLPLVLTRTHLQGDNNPRPFGIGTTDSFDINLYSENQYQEVDLYVPGNAKIHYARTSLS